jgi:methionyl-tRNA formyltransferase
MAPARRAVSTIVLRSHAEGAVRILQLQRAGKQPMNAEEFLRGTPIRAGVVLG